MFQKKKTFDFLISLLVITVQSNEEVSASFPRIRSTPRKASSYTWGKLRVIDSATSLSPAWYKTNESGVVLFEGAVH